MMSTPDFVRPKDLAEALKYLADPERQSTILAGGTDIIPGLHQKSQRFSSIKRLIAVDHLSELNRIKKNKSNIEIGAAVTFSRLADDPIIRSVLPILSDAAGRIGSVQIRNRATIAGNFVNNAPCADSGPPLLVYDARIRLRSLRNETEIPLNEFLTGPYKTRLKPDQLVTAVIIPAPGSDWSGKFYKLGRRRGVAVSRISLAILLKKRGPVIRSVRIACGAVTPVAVRLQTLEERCAGQEATPDFLRNISARLGEEVLKITGLRWSTPYKLPVLQQIFYQILGELTEPGS